MTATMIVRDATVHDVAELLRSRQVLIGRPIEGWLMPASLMPW
jgi:hypothetical protein